MKRTGRRILVLYWHPPGQELRPAIRHHLEVLERKENDHQLLYINTYGAAPIGLWRLPCEAIVLHTTLLCMRWSHLFYTWKEKWRWLRDFEGPKIALPQDEYDHSEILDEWLFELGVTDIFTNFDASRRKLLYPLMSAGAHFQKCFTGYIDEGAAKRCSASVKPIGARDVEIVYRASRLPFWFGSHGQLKHQVGTAVTERALRRGLKIDISTRSEDTIVGEGWFEFLMSGRVVVGCESGSSVLDRRGEIRARIQRILGECPQLSFEELARRMPGGWDDYRFFALSPRHFEAIITKTCQILVEGEYEGVLVPWRHYIPLKRDFSNLDEVLDLTQDVALLQRLADCAYDEVYLGGRHSYEVLRRDVEAVVVKDQRRPGSSATSLLWSVTTMCALAQTRASDLIDKSHPAWLSGWWYRLYRAPRSAAAKGIVAVRLVLTDAPLRRLLLVYLSDREVRASVRLVYLMDDLLRLAIARRILAGKARSFGAQVDYDSVESKWILRSVFNSRGPAAVVRSRGREALARIEWDHSAIGTSLHWGQRQQLAIRMGPNGVHSFVALVVLARRHTDAVWDALSTGSARAQA